MVKYKGEEIKFYISLEKEIDNINRWEDLYSISVYVNTDKDSVCGFEIFIDDKEAISICNPLKLMGNTLEGTLTSDMTRSLKSGNIEFNIYCKNKNKNVCFRHTYKSDIILVDKS